MRKAISVLLLCAMLLPALLLTSCANSEPRSDGCFLFDTYCYILDYSADSEQTFRARCDAVWALLRAYEKEFDIYHTYETPNLATVNAQAGGDAVAVSEELFTFLETAVGYGTLTGGAVDITYGALTSLWNDARRAADAKTAESVAPTAEQITEAKAHVGASLLELDAQAKTVRLTDAAASIDVGAVGKGYACERAAKLLETMGAENYVLNLGGNLRAVGGKPNGEPFTAGVKDPSGESVGGIVATLSLSDASFVTSGAYERYFIAGGKRYGHVVDLTTGYPSERYASVSVLTKDSGLADALSTAFFCMDEAEIEAFLQQNGGIGAVLVRQNGEVVALGTLGGKLTLC